MIFSAGNFLLIGSILLFVSILAGKTGYRFGVPALLLFLLVGMAFGSDGLGIQFSNYKATQFIGMVALSIILFSGGMDTRGSDIKPVAKLKSKVTFLKTVKEGTSIGYNRSYITTKETKVEVINALIISSSHFFVLNMLTMRK